VTDKQLKTRFTTLVMAIFLAAMFSTHGYSNPESREHPRLTQEQVIRIAEETAKSEGYDLPKYNMTGCHYEYTVRDHSWTVFFSLKPPTPPGGHFSVWVDDRTQKARVMRGE
jgi:hypothetical protein